MKKWSIVLLAVVALLTAGTSAYATDTAVPSKEIVLRGPGETG